MKDEEASERGRERQARRRQFDPDEVVDRLDKRGTRTARFKVIKLHITMSDELLAAVDARASTMNYGRGMPRSTFIEYVMRMFLQKGRAAREFQRDWKETQEARQ